MVTQRPSSQVQWCRCVIGSNAGWSARAIARRNTPPFEADTRTVDYPRYDPASPITPLTTAELDALDALLQALPSDGAMTMKVKGTVEAWFLDATEGTGAPDQNGG